MPRKDEVDRIERAARAAGYRDGLLELTAAAMLALLALGWVAAPGMVGVVAALFVVFGWRLRSRLKERVTYPRIGYSQEKAESGPRSARGAWLIVVAGAAGMIAAAALSGGVDRVESWRRMAPLASGVWIGVGLWAASVKSGLIRYRFLAVLSAVAGVTLWVVTDGSDYRPVAAHLAVTAAALALFGVVALAAFIRHHPHVRPRE